MKAMDRGSRQARKERIAVVEVWKNEWGDQFHCSRNISYNTAKTQGEDVEKKAHGPGR